MKRAHLYYDVNFMRYCVRTDPSLDIPDELLTDSREVIDFLRAHQYTVCPHECYLLTSRQEPQGTFHVFTNMPFNAGDLWVVLTLFVDDRGGCTIRLSDPSRAGYLTAKDVGTLPEICAQYGYWYEPKGTQPSLIPVSTSIWQVLQE